MAAVPLSGLWCTITRMRAPRLTNRPRSRLRGALFRLAAVALGISPLIALEIACRLFGWGLPDVADDPFVGFRGTRPLFVLDAERGRYEIAKNRQTFFRPDGFAAEKPAGELRIFCLGGSTVQGRPFAIETSFTTWLELGLAAADPSRRWEVVNCGGVSYASYRLVPLLAEVLGHEADLIIVYTGHNEFLEERSYGHLKRRSPVATRALELAAKSRLFLALRDFVAGGARPASPAGRPVLPEEVEALLDYRGGLEAYERDEDLRRGVVAHFRHNLLRMVRLTEEAGVPLLLVNPVENLADCPPFKSLPGDGLSADARRRFEELWETARAHYARSKHVAVEYLEEAAAIDPLHAGIRFAIGTCYEDLGRLAEARAAYLAAKNLDICPLRMTEPLHDALLDVASSTGTPLLDARALFEGESETGIPGADLLIDHVHPAIEGHKTIAGALLETLAALGVVRPRDGWQVRRDELYDAHEASLGDSYYAIGMGRLEGLRTWARGRATMIRGEKE